VSLPALIVVTGTDTGVGKTVTTAAVAAVLTARGRRVSVYKPCQSGAARGDSDCDEIFRLAATPACAGVVLGEPLAPVPAARLDRIRLPTVTAHAERIQRMSQVADHVLVEGSGGLLVELDEDGRTLADLTALLGDEAGCVVVSRPGLGTLNHTALTVEAVQRRRLGLLGIVLGAWPREPGAAEVHNRRAFERGTVPLLGIIPEGASAHAPAAFRERSGDWLAGLPR